MAIRRTDIQPLSVSELSTEIPRALGSDFIFSMALMFAKEEQMMGLAPCVEIANNLTTSTVYVAIIYSSDLTYLVFVLNLNMSLVHSDGHKRLLLTPCFNSMLKFIST